jgi:peptide/nickel transport system ATP-binding protein
MAASDHVLRIEDLRVEFQTRRGPAVAVDGISLHIDRGEVLGVVGESGCGKSVTALSVLQLLDYPGRIASGRIELAGQNLLEFGPRKMREVRGKRVAMIFQDPSTTLNPVFRIGDQITDVLKYHGGAGRREGKRRAAELLDMVGIPSPGKRLAQYPHQMSGGMQQRVVIAIALALKPELLLADEPTTALDVTIQAEILDLIARLQDETGTATMMITHDVGVVAQTCDRVAVMYAGKIIETGRVADVIERPAHPYTVGLIDAVPRLASTKAGGLRSIAGSVPDIVHLPSGCRFHPRCPHAMDICTTVEPHPVEARHGQTVACHLYSNGSNSDQASFGGDRLRTTIIESPMPRATSAEPAASPLLRVERLVKEFPAGWQRSGTIPRRRSLRAVDEVSFEIGPGEALGLVGESGCGKSTTARIVMRLYEPTSGHVFLEGVNLTDLSRAQLFERRRLFQMVFQNPYASLDPRWTVERVVGEPLDVHDALSRAERGDRVLGLLSSVSLGGLHLNRYPHQLSGGQRQRVAIARALALNARLLVADEPVSSLDVSIQAQILELLTQLKEELGLSLLFISHNLAVVNYLCERVAVMYAGQIVETGRAEDVLRSPRHPYTKVLVSSIPEPTLDSRRERIIASGDVPLTVDGRSYCPFHTRCPWAREICREQAPPDVAVGNGQVARCHLVASGEL